ncbi:flagellar hook-length control protein FliK [Sinorhizobium sp. 7-81]|uniref:flagellar hook-length control protein FliK n=1 Tax=Sinorhizobium sp. 8-89 TaxID=3049089 RepID=UPI0024C250C9|nr:flagellar hook-length control protein FliK [Sinorhizobium sp. 8-89]MDK1488524.1 flagellar hook-length control protein FliK [Sinorhizobium sp. 8-89]
MKPLDESLRSPIPAATGKAGSRQGGREEIGEAPRAFQDVIADTGRQKAQGQGPAISDANRPIDNSSANGLQGLLGDDTATGGRDRRGSIGRNGMEGTWDAASLQDLGNSVAEDAIAADKDRSSDSLSVREHALKRLRRVGLGKEHAPVRSDPAAGSEQHADALPQKADAVARGQVRAAGGVPDEVRTEAGQEDPSGPADPKGTVDDLLTLLGAAAAVTAALQQPEDEADRSSGGRPVPGNAVGIEGGEAVTDIVPDESLHAEKDASESDQLFRFARADGKGQAMSMTISADGEKAVVDTGKPAAASKAENVTVLEARRYLGLAMNANAASVTSAIAGDSDWAQLMHSSATLGQPEASAQVGKTLNTLKIQLHPIDLGTVTATLRLKDDELQVDLKVESGEAFRQLRDDQGEMVKALRAQGFAVDQVNIVFNAGGDASGGGGQQQQAQTGPDQQGREHAGEGSGQGRQRQNDAQGSAAGRWAGNDGLDGAPVDAEHPRAGYVYM